MKLKNQKIGEITVEDMLKDILGRTSATLSFRGDVMNMKNRIREYLEMLK